jgi:ribose/xylose/arabinose/galactoside ABC-type transport system permease subunit
MSIEGERFGRGGYIVTQAAALALTTIRRGPMIPVLIIGLATFALFVDDFLSLANLSNMGRLLAPLLVIAVGATFVFLIGGIDLSIGSTVGLASVLMALTTKSTGSIPAGVFVGMSTGLAVGFVNAVAISALRLPSFIHTLGMLLTIRASAMWITEGRSVGRLPLAVTTFGRSTLFYVPSILWISIVICLSGAALLRWTKLGRELYLVGSNGVGARFNAINLTKVVFVAYLACGLMSGITAVLVVMRLGSGGPVVGDNMLLTGIAAVVLGGTSIGGGFGGMLRTASGAAVVILLDKGLNLLGLAYYDQQICIGIVIVAGSALGSLLYRARALET